MSGESLFDNSEAFFQRGIGSEFLSQADEGTDDINTHGHSFWAIENIGCLERPMFGKGPRQRATSTAAGF
jgi:hypothetical protein